MSGARLLRQGSSTDAPPVTSEQVTFQVFGRSLAAQGTWAAVLVNRASTAVNVTLDFGELGVPSPSSARLAVRDAGARLDLGTFSQAFSAEVPARDAQFLVLKLA